MRTIVLAAVIVSASIAQGAGQEPLRLVGTIDLPHVEGRIDHMAFDPDGERLLISALGNGTVEVVDTRGGRRVRTLTGFREPQGIAFAPSLDLVVVANGEGPGIQLLEGRDLRAGPAIALGDDADNVRYDAAEGRFYVGYASGALAEIDPRQATVVGTVRLPAHPESFQLDPSGSRLFVNVPDAQEIAVIDRRTMRVVSTWPVVGARSNFPMALDAAGHRLFIGCRQPARVLVYDVTTGKEVEAFDTVGDTDDLFYDAAQRRLYVSGGQGDVDVFQQTDTGGFHRIARVATAPGARTSLFVPAQHRLYVAVPHRGRQPASIRVYQTPGE